MNCKWINCPLEKIAYILNGFAFKSKKYTDSGIRIIRIANVQDGFVEDDKPVFYPLDTQTEIENYILNEGDLLMSLTGNVGRVALMSKDMLPAALNQRVACLRVKDSTVVSTRYLFHYFRQHSFQKNCVDNSKGTAQLNMSTEWLKKYEIQLPSLEEQHRIVERIESLFSQLDEARDKAQEALEGFELRRTKTIRNAFEGKYTTEWRRQHGYKIEDWENLTLNDVAEYKKGPFGSSITKAMFVPKGDDTYKVYEQGNAIRKTLAYGHYYISKEKYQELKGFAIQGGDIIISCAGTIGEVYRLPDNCEPGVINQALMRVRLFDNITERFFVYYFGEVLKGDVIDNANGTAMNNIPPFKIMKAMQIKLPSIEEQDAIVRFLDATIEKEQRVIDELENTLDEIELIRKTILMKAFRGELGTNNPGDERAVELLKATVESAKETK